MVAQRHIKTLFLIILVTLITLQLSYAETLSDQSMTILAVSEYPNGTLFGGTATLELEIVPGKGRVFIDTFPLTKVDTQVSTRSAKQIACDFLDRDCSNYDFIYTIKSGSAIIGGPSAGAAMTALTIATLDGEHIKKGVSISGTINPGGIVGSVGGLQQKIEAANSRGIHTVIIPSGEAIQKQPQQNTPVDFTQNVTSNDTETENTEINLITYGEEIGVNVIEASNIYEVLSVITDKEYPYINEAIAIPPYYQDTMRQIATQMCTRSQETLNSLNIKDYPITNTTTVSITRDAIIFKGNDTILEAASIDINATYNTAKDLQEYGRAAIEFEQFYAAASYCYGTNLNLFFLAALDKSYDALLTEANKTVTQHELDLSNYKTITDLQTYMLVEERIAEAKEQFEQAQEFYQNNRTDDAKNRLITAIERINSARQWSAFAKNYGNSYDFNSAQLRQSCQLKLQEAEERYNYLLLYAPFATHLRSGIDSAQEYSNTGLYELCLHQSSLAKAEIDVILGTTGVNNETLIKTVNNRITLVEQVILKQIQKGNFPIIGYSYLEYAKSLAQNDPESSLLYLQYAIELSNMDLFFSESTKTQISIVPLRKNKLNIDIRGKWFILGMLTASLLILITHLFFIKGRRHKKQKSTHKK